MHGSASGPYKLGMDCHKFEFVCFPGLNFQQKDRWMEEAHRLVDDLIVSPYMGPFICDLLRAVARFECAYGVDVLDSTEERKKTALILHELIMAGTKMRDVVAVGQENHDAADEPTLTTHLLFRLFLDAL